METSVEVIKYALIAFKMRFKLHGNEEQFNF